METSSPDVNFELFGLFNYLDKKNIVGPTVGTILSTGLMEVITEIFGILLILMFGKDITKETYDDTGSETKKESIPFKYEINIRNKKIDIGKLLISLIKLIMIIYVSILITSFFKKFKT